MYYLPADATNEIKKRLRESGQVVFIQHAEGRMCKRDIDDQEAVMALRSGAVRVPGELKDGEYRYKVESNLNGGIMVVVEIPEGNLIIIAITVMSSKKRKRRS